MALVYVMKPGVCNNIFIPYDMELAMRTQIDETFKDLT